MHNPQQARVISFNSPRSLKHEYEVFVESEIEYYKDSIPRHTLLKIGDEAAESIRSQLQFALTELLIWQEVDRIIARRINLPTYSTWKRRRLKVLEQYRKPEHWGFDANAPFVRALQDSVEGHVLVAGHPQEGRALYLAAHGCAVTALEEEEDTVERVVKAAAAAGITERVRSQRAHLSDWAPDVELHAVVCSPAAFSGLSAAERARVIQVLQSATADGGVHLVETIALGTEGATGSMLEELASRYRGWQVSIENDVRNGGIFVARKAS